MAIRDWRRYRWGHAIRTVLIPGLGPALALVLGWFVQLFFILTHAAALFLILMAIAGRPPR